jgi:hypothetical protein
VPDRDRGSHVNAFGYSAVIGNSGMVDITAVLTPRYQSRLLVTGRWAEAGESVPAI